MGLDYTPIYKEISPMIYTSGIHFLGFAHSFIEYPQQVQTMEFSVDSTSDRSPIESRSIDGMMVTFSVQFQYTIDQQNLLDLYLKYGEDYKNPCIRYAVDCLND